jgi:hypothetical protein
MLRYFQEIIKTGILPVDEKESLETSSLSERKHGNFQPMRKSFQSMRGNAWKSPVYERESLEISSVWERSWETPNVRESLKISSLWERARRIPDSETVARKHPKNATEAFHANETEARSSWSETGNLSVKKSIVSIFVHSRYSSFLD